MSKPDMAKVCEELAELYRRIEKSNDFRRMVAKESGTETKNENEVTIHKHEIDAIVARMVELYAMVDMIKEQFDNCTFNDAGIAMFSKEWIDAVRGRLHKLLEGK